MRLVGHERARAPRSIRKINTLSSSMGRHDGHLRGRIIELLAQRDPWTYPDLVAALDVSRRQLDPLLLKMAQWGDIEIGCPGHSARQGRCEGHESHSISRL